MKSFFGIRQVYSNNVLSNFLRNTWDVTNLRIKVLYMAYKDNDMFIIFKPNITHVDPKSIKDNIMTSLLDPQMTIIAIVMKFIHHLYKLVAMHSKLPRDHNRQKHIH